MKILAYIKSVFSGRTKKKPARDTRPKKVYCFKGNEFVAEYDSISKCGSALHLTRPMVKRAIGSGIKLDNGLILKFHK